MTITDASMSLSAQLNKAAVGAANHISVSE
jgi:hypothetical protein